MSIFQSDCIKIVLSDQIPKVKSVSRDEGDDDAAAQPHTAPEYFIHRSLLSSLSLELYKHINNDMKEGRENVLELSEVDAGTLDNFLGWAYFKDYKLYVTHSLLLIISTAYLNGSGAEWSSLVVDQTRKAPRA